MSSPIAEFQKLDETTPFLLRVEQVSPERSTTTVRLADRNKLGAVRLY